jgi:hypothetical protein
MLNNFDFKFIYSPQLIFIFRMISQITSANTIRNAITNTKCNVLSEIQVINIRQVNFKFSNY